jgi:hypothetical protein
MRRRRSYRRGSTGVTEVGVSPDVRAPITMYRAIVPDLRAEVDMNSRGWSWLDLVGRLKVGVGRAQALQSYSGIAPVLASSEAFERTTGIPRCVPTWK